MIIVYFEVSERRSERLCYNTQLRIHLAGFSYLDIVDNTNGIATSLPTVSNATDQMFIAHVPNDFFIKCEVLDLKVGFLTPTLSPIYMKSVQCHNKTGQGCRGAGCLNMNDAVWFCNDTNSGTQVFET